MATTFTDKKGRTWDVALDLRKARQIDKADLSAISEDYKFSILKPDRVLYGKLITDAPFLFAIIWAMVQDQAEAKYTVHLSAQTDYDSRGSLSKYADRDSGFSFTPPADSFPTSPKEQEAAELEFVSGVNGPTIEAARNAIIEALADFFPEQRTVLSTLMRQSKKLSEKVGKKMEESEPLMDSLLDEELDLGIKQLQASLLKTRETRLGEMSMG